MDLTGLCRGVTGALCKGSAQLAKRELPTLTVDTYRSIFGFPVEDYYRRVGFNLEMESMADLSSEFFATYGPGLKDCLLHDRVIETLL